MSPANDANRHRAVWKIRLPDAGCLSICFMSGICASRPVPATKTSAMGAAVRNRCFMTVALRTTCRSARRYRCWSSTPDNSGSRGHARPGIGVLLDRVAQTASQVLSI